MAVPTRDREAQPINVRVGQARCGPARLILRMWRQNIGSFDRDIGQRVAVEGALVKYQVIR